MGRHVTSTSYSTSDFSPIPTGWRSYGHSEGPTQRVAEYVMSEDAAKEFVDRADEMLAFLIPHFEAEGKSYLSVGIGCTGGHHRSVAIAEELGRRLAQHGITASVRHRDIER